MKGRFNLHVPDCVKPSLIPKFGLCSGETGSTNKTRQKGLHKQLLSDVVANWLREKQNKLQCSFVNCFSLRKAVKTQVKHNISKPTYGTSQGVSQKRVMEVGLMGCGPDKGKGSGGVGLWSMLWGFQVEEFLRKEVIT